MDYTGQIDGRLLHGCIQEAERSTLVGLGLDGLRSALPETFHPHMNALIEEIRASSHILRDLADRSQVYYTRVPVVLNYLNVVLPCLSRSLRDITTYYEDRTISKELRWRKMYHKMTEESGGIPLPQRFVLYNHFLTLLLQLLTRDPNFDLNTLEVMRTRILELREKRGIAPPPVQVGPLMRAEMMMPPMHSEGNVHWAELIFSLPLPSRTALKHTEKSKSFGPHQQWGQLSMPSDAKLLFRRVFDNDRLSVIAYLNGINRAPFLIVRTYHMGTQWFSARGAHEICIRRNRSAIELRRWSQSEGRAKLWATLFFMTWEELVLFHCTFLSLKARNNMTIQINPNEYKLHGERRLFQAQILDDGFKHSLIVYQDKETEGTRLHAAVWDGRLRQVPVWTAFVTHQSASPTWLVKKSKHRIWLKDIQLYVFCHRYRQQNQRQGRGGAFELRFASEEAATRFAELFAPRKSPPTVSTESSGEKEAGPSK